MGTPFNHLGTQLVIGGGDTYPNITIVIICNFNLATNIFVQFLYYLSFYCLFVFVSWNEYVFIFLDFCYLVL